MKTLLQVANQEQSVDRSTADENSRVRSGAFRISNSPDGIWGVYDEQDELVYSGTLDGCQMWLDGNDNLLREPGFWTFVKNLLAHRTQQGSKEVR